jgi:hypothetical protein
MVDMRVGEQHHVDVFGRELEGSAVALVTLRASLDQPAIQKNPTGGRFDQVAGARDLASRPVK